MANWARICSISYSPGMSAKVSTGSFDRDRNNDELAEQVAGAALDSPDLIILPELAATPGENSLFIDPMGQVIDQSWMHGRVVTRRINFDYEVLYLDYNNTRFEAIKRVYGPDVELRILVPEAICMLISHHPTVTAAETVKAFDLWRLGDYFDAARRIRSDALAGTFPKPGKSPF